MTKRRITKASKRRLTIFGTISVVAIVYFCFSLVYSGYNIYVLTQEKNKLDSLYVELQERADELKLDIAKLNDLDYLADYARENYLYTDDDEYVIKIEEIIETKTELDALSSSIDKKYIFIGLIFIIGLMFIYILFRSRNKSTQKKS